MSWHDVIRSYRRSIYHYGSTRVAMELLYGIPPTESISCGSVNRQTPFAMALSLRLA